MAQLFSNQVEELIQVNVQTGSSTIGTGDLASASVGLVNSSSVTLDTTTTYADVLAAEGGYPGYARQAITWNAASVADDGTVEAVGTVPEFRPTGTSTVNMWGLFLTTSDSATLALVGALDAAPLPMTDAHSAIVVTLRYRPTLGGLGVDVS